MLKWKAIDGSNIDQFLFERLAASGCAIRQTVCFPFNRIPRHSKNRLNGKISLLAISKVGNAITPKGVEGSKQTLQVLSNQT